MVPNALCDDHLTQLKVVTWTLNAQKYQEEIQESDVRSPLDLLDGQNMVLRDGIARPHCTPIIEEYKNQQIIASLPWPSLLPDLTRVGQAWLTCFKPETSSIKVSKDAKIRNRYIKYHT